MAVQRKVALVIGCGKNLNDENVRELVQQGTAFALHYSSPGTRDRVIQFRDALQRLHRSRKISIHFVDLGEATAVEKLFNDVLALHNRIDVVVNSAGTLLRKPITGAPEAEYDKMFAYAVFVDEQRRKWVDLYERSISQPRASTLRNPMT